MKRETYIIFFVILALLMVSMLTVYSAEGTGKEDFSSKSHLQKIAVGLFLLFIAAHFDYRLLRNPAFVRAAAVITLGMLVVVLLFGIEVNGAKRWIQLPGFRFQPSEFAKLALIILLAAKLADNQGEIKGFVRGFLPPVIIAGLFMGLVLLENDLGGPVVMGVCAMLMVFLAGARWRYVVGSLLPGVAGVAVLCLVEPHRIDRLLAYRDPWGYRSNEGLQLVQGMFAFVRGGLFGTGAGAGEQKLRYLPEAHTDFIFSVWGEEMGLIGTLAVVLLFVLLLWMAVRVAISAPDLFGTLLAGGIASLIAFQASFNMAVVTGLLPTKGLALPFVSYGGTAMMIFLLAAGILLNIARQAEPIKEGAACAS